ncbi:MAG: glycerophosphodiester phosphodiesterase [Anaerolineae bacterium]|nr:glycerophosphodiester phosphodiesterase [Anaerolineae bacterium]
MDWETAKTPLIFAHRGASHDEPENTLAAFGLAAAQKADGIELDVQLSADGWPVVIHDFTVERTTNGRGKVAELSLSDLQALTIEGGEKIPTLDEVFEAFGPQFVYNIEIKDLSWRNRGLEAAIADRIKAYHLEESVIISSFNPFSLKRFRNCAPSRIPTALLRDKGFMRVTSVFNDGEGDNPHFSLVDASYMRWAAQHAYKVIVWTVDDPDEALRLKNLGVDGLITNKPGLLRSVLEQGQVP